LHTKSVKFIFRLPLFLFLRLFTLAKKVVGANMSTHCEIQMITFKYFVCKQHRDQLPHKGIYRCTAGMGKPFQPSIWFCTSSQENCRKGMKNVFP
jgi:hypothetical protein